MCVLFVWIIVVTKVKQNMLYLINWAETALAQLAYDCVLVPIHLDNYIIITYLHNYSYYEKHIKILYIIINVLWKNLLWMKKLKVHIFSAFINVLVLCPSSFLGIFSQPGFFQEIERWFLRKLWKNWRIFSEMYSCIPNSYVTERHFCPLKLNSWFLYYMYFTVIL